MCKGVLLGVAAGVALISVASGYVAAAGPEPHHPENTASHAAFHAAPGQQPARVPTATASAQRAVVDRYCVTCHNQRRKAGGLVLESLDLGKVDEGAEVWEKVVRKLRAGMMPPPGMPRPNKVAYDGFASWLETELDRSFAARPNPGRTSTFHRLNRFEYKTVVRDLLALDIDVDTLLPTDDAGYGFDNIAGLLKVSESLMERYLAAARKISRVAVGNPPAAPAAETFAFSEFLRQYERGEGLPFGTRGGALIRYNFPQDAQYSLRVSFTCNNTSVEGCDPTSGFDDTHDLEVTIDGERVHLYTLEPRSFSAAPVAGKGAPDQWEFRVLVKAGLREIGVAFLRLPTYEPSDRPRVRFMRPYYEGNQVATGMGVYQPHLQSVTIGGPFDTITGGVPDTHSRRRIFVCGPATPADEPACAKKILSTLARRAYRRPVTGQDLQPLLAFYNDGRTQGGKFESGIEMALRAVLVSPEFLFRTEADPTTEHSNANYRITDLELASRLSFFLWSSIPDDELLNVAAQGRLKDPETLERQVRRMLADTRSQALMKNFLPQWLQLRKLEFVSPAADLYPDWDDSLRDGLRTETELFFEHIVREDRSVLELLTANYSLLNERVAVHYGIRGVRGSHFRNVTFTEDNPRRGLLGHGSVLTVTSYAIRTSPVVRGKWILDTLLGAPPPAPPPNVPPLDEKRDVSQTLTMRERMAAHRANPVCAGCHSIIDPAGFALENFDAVGRWRTTDYSGKPIDTSGSLPDGTKFEGFAQFQAALASSPDRFVAALTEKLLIYALGRGLEYYDMPTIRAITRESARDNYRFSALISGIVKSVPFQMRSTQSSSAAVDAARHLAPGSFR